MKKLVLVVLATLCILSCGEERAKFVEPSAPQAERQFLTEVPAWAIALHRAKGGCDGGAKNTGEWKPLVFPDYKKAFTVGCSNGQGVVLALDFDSRKILAEVEHDKGHHVGDLVYYAHIRATQLDSTLCGGKSVQSPLTKEWVRYDIPCQPSQTEK